MNTSALQIPVLGFVAYSGTGKTTLLTKVVALLRDQGLRLAVIKHSHHDFEIDKPGKDSHRLREAGAQQVLLASPYRTFWVTEGDGASEPVLADLVARLDLSILDLVLVEGFRQEAIAKIEVHRPSLATPLLCTDDERVIAVASDSPLSQEISIPCLPLNEPEKVATFVGDWLRSVT